MRSRELFSETILPIHLQIEIHQCTGESAVTRKEERWCHYYLHSPQNTLELYMVQQGRMERVAVFVNAFAVEEIPAENDKEGTEVASKSFSC